MPVCKKCKQEKSPEEFCKSNFTKSGYLLTCKVCRNAKQRGHYEKKTPEQRLERHQKQYEKNKEKVKQKYLERRHTEEYKKVKRAYSEKRRTRETYRKWKESRKEALREYYTMYFHRRRKNDPLFALRMRVSNLILKQLQAGYTEKSKKTTDLLGCSYETLMEHLGPKPEGNYHLDHIVPCAQAKNAEELIKLQHYTNFRWLPAKENLEKCCSRTPEGEELCRKLLGREWED